MVTPTNHVIVRGLWHFEDFRNIFLPNIGEDQKKVLLSECGARGTVPYVGKSGSGYFITFVKRLDEGLRWQLFGQKPLIDQGYAFKLVGKN